MAFLNRIINVIQLYVLFIKKQIQFVFCLRAFICAVYEQLMLNVHSETINPSIEKRNYSLNCQLSQLISFCLKVQGFSRVMQHHFSPVFLGSALFKWVIVTYHSKACTISNIFIQEAKNFVNL